ncbi:hypothetical protein BH09BAC5_BH09BAC5_20870 [soil metagenome]
MENRKYYFVLIIALAFCNTKVFAQEMLVPLTSNPIQAAEASNLAAQRSIATFPTDTVVLPSIGLRDNFSYNSHRPDTSLWELDGSIISNAVTSGVFINRTWAFSPINIGVCTFDGLKYNGEPYNVLAPPASTGQCDELMSRPLDLSSYSVADSVYLSFWYQAGGRGYMPNAQDSFLLDFDIPGWNPDQFTLAWKNIWFKNGYNSANDSSFHIVMIKLDSASYFTKGFRFRFHNYASQCGSNDHWHLDDVFIKSSRTFSDTIVKEASFVYDMPSFIKDFHAMPASHYKPSINMIDTVSISIRNNDIVSTGRNITYEYDVLDESGTSVFNYSGGSATLLPYNMIGYSNTQANSRPAIYPANYSGFPTFPVNDTGFFTIRHKLIDGSRVDSADSRQSFYNYYAYDDGTAEVGYGLYGQYSQLAYKFTMPVAIDDTLRAIQMYFLPVLDITNLQQREFTLKVWNDGGNQPGTVIYSKAHQSPNYSFETPDRFISYSIDSAIIHLSPGQTYYIGWEQQAIDRLYIGFDYNSDHSDKIYYNTNGNWTPSIFDGSLMMRPVFGTPYSTGDDQSGINEQNNEVSFSVYPNPANDHFSISGMKNSNQSILLNIIDISGRIVTSSDNVINGEAIDVSGLSAGIYFVQLRNANGDLLGTQRLILAH